MTTRGSSRAAFDHVLDIVLARGDDTPLKQALIQNGYTDNHALTLLSIDVIDTLTYNESETTTDVQVLRFEKALISAFLDFIIHRNLNNNPVGNNWTSITKEAFDEFRIDPNYLASRRSGQTVQIPSYTPKQITSSAELFRKGVRRDQNIFPTLKDEKFHDSWHRGFENQAHAQLVAEVLDPNYVPPTPQDQEVFEMKQIFIYTVLEGKVMTSKGKEIIRKFEDTRDGQKVYKELTHYHRSSTAASMAARDIMGYLTSVTIGDGRFRGNTVEFLTHWTQQAKLYQKLMGTSSTFSDGEKLDHLVRAEP
jgi:hypothetical protein